MWYIEARLFETSEWKGIMFGNMLTEDIKDLERHVSDKNLQRVYSGIRFRNDSNNSVIYHGDSDG